ncbi:hypothetical protein OSB04_008133 [Centaurea solstitialis]|uniref:Protein phosphatase methylesterase-1 n=1 Tax=Centaurea solstitialis TaxID=347529 RepID=A0AA38U5P5_9ASTR|nr:hypothetical protein OSB04_008133 [Centaurea solstitialis]
MFVGGLESLVSLSAGLSQACIHRFLFNFNEQPANCCRNCIGLQQVVTNVLVASRYEGLSEKFLSSPVPKLLLLAGTDRLDRALTIGQMQGKFQMVVVRHTGHAIQEDVPEEFASLVLNFIARNRIGPYGVEIPGIRQPSKPHG